MALHLWCYVGRQITPHLILTVQRYIDGLLPTHGQVVSQVAICPLHRFPFLFHLPRPPPLPPAPASAAGAGDLSVEAEAGRGPRGERSRPGSGKLRRRP